MTHKIVEKKINKDIYGFTIKTTCPHCGRKVVLNPAMMSEAFAPGKDEKESCYLVRRCLNCDNLTLFRVNGAYEDKETKFIEGLIDENVEQLWPSEKNIASEIPEKVIHYCQEAQPVRLFPSPYVVQIGRALEAIAHDKGAKGKSLFHKLNWLIDQEFLPKTVGEMAHINRLLRNYGAHDLDIEVEKEDIEIVDEFFWIIVEYIYIVPAKLKRVQNLLNTRKSST